MPGLIRQVALFAIIGTAAGFNSKKIFGGVAYRRSCEQLFALDESSSSDSIFSHEDVERIERLRGDFLFSQV